MNIRVLFIDMVDVLIPMGVINAITILAYIIARAVFNANAEIWNGIIILLALFDIPIIIASILWIIREAIDPA